MKLAPSRLLSDRRWQREPTSRYIFRWSRQSSHADPMDKETMTPALAAQSTKFDAVVKRQFQARGGRKADRKRAHGFRETSPLNAVAGAFVATFEGEFRDAGFVEVAQAFGDHMVVL